MIKMICDRCRKTIIFDEATKIVIGDEKHNSQKEKDFCPNCIREIEDFINRIPETKTKVVNLDTKKVDAGKVIALHMAGWNTGRIADELSITENNVEEIIERRLTNETNDNTNSKSKRANY